MPLDTLAVARQLAQHGFTQDQADALTDAVRQAAGFPDISALATKADLARLDDMLARLDATKADVARLEVRLDDMATKADLAGLAARINDMATKTDLAGLAARLDDMATKADLASLAVATKADLKAGLATLEVRLTDKMFRMIMTAVLINIVGMLGVIGAVFAIVWMGYHG